MDHGVHFEPWFNVLTTCYIIYTGSTLLVCSIQCKV